MEEPTPQQPNTAKKVVIVDDDYGFCESIAQRLRADSVQVLTANEGKAALELILKEHPDLVMMDVVMPGMTGTDLLRTLREDEWGKHAKVVMVSNVDSVDAYNEALSVGANDYYSKSEMSLEDMAKFIHDRL